MSITFKDFALLAEMADEEYSKAIEEGLSDLPGFGWLKDVGTNPAKKKAALAKIAAERTKLQALKTSKAKELDAAFAKAKGEIEGGSKSQVKGAISADDHVAAFADRGDLEKQERRAARSGAQSDHLAFRASHAR